MKKVVKVIPSMFWLIGIICAIIGGYSILIVIYSLESARNQLDIISHIIYIVFTGVLPTLILILSVQRGVFSVVTFSENGVKRSLFAGLFKVEMSWEEMKEMRFYVRLLPYIFFSKTSTLEGLTYDSIIKKKDIIQVDFTKKVYNAIKQFTDREIVNLPENFTESN